MSINRVNITGNLTRDPELRATAAGTQVLSFGIAVNDRRKNPQTGERATLLRDEVVNPYRIIHRPGTHVPVGALYLGDTPRTRFFDEKSPEARLYRSLEAAFGGPVYITSSTRDGRVVLVETWAGERRISSGLVISWTRMSRISASRSTELLLSSAASSVSSVSEAVSGPKLRLVCRTAVASRRNVQS